jgi:serine protease Do
MNLAIRISHPFSAALAVMAGLSIIISISAVSAESRYPEKGSVSFGSNDKPIQKHSAEYDFFKNAFANVAEKVIPSVVSVIPTKIDTVVFSNNPFYQFFGDGDDQFFGDSPFGEFFGQQQPRNQQKQKQQKQEYRRSQGLGSGVIVSMDGYILTNFHVVSGADEIQVKTSDGRTFDANIIGVDSLSDVAVIKIKGDVNNLTVAYIGDSDKLRPGEWVMAVGNPFSLTSTVTQGIVSALGRAVDNSTQYQNYIQTDAAINPGNSGGALVNLDGELIGINTMIVTRSGGFMGIGMAIPINMAKKAMEDIIYEGKVTRGWLGVQIQDINDAMRNSLSMGDRKGVLVSDVFKNQPGDKAGIKHGDVVLSIDGKSVGNSNELRNIVAILTPGKKFPVVILRDGKEQTVTVVLTERNEKNIAKTNGKTGEDSTVTGDDETTKLGIHAGAITNELRNKYAIDAGTTGIVVVNVDQASQAAAEGIKEGDFIQ